MKLTIDQDKCIHCGLCSSVCILTRFCGFDSLEQAAEQHCIGCGHCVAACPRGAVTHAEIKRTEPIGVLPRRDEFLNLIMKTRSVRHFKAAPVHSETWEIIRRIMECSQSGLNAQEIRLIAIEHADTLSNVRKAAMRMYGKLEKLARFPVTRILLKLGLNRRDYHSVMFESSTHSLRREAVERGEDPILYGAPALVLLTGPKKSQTGREDATVIAQNIMLAMTSMGLGSCYMGGLVLGCRLLRHKPLLQALPSPEGQEVYQAFVLGTPAVQLRRMPERKPREILFR